MSGADSRVRSPGTLTCARCPAVRSALDAGPEAYDHPAAVWWGAFAASAVIRGRAAGAGRVASGRETRSGHWIQDGKPRVHDSNPDLAYLNCQLGSLRSGPFIWPGLRSGLSMSDRDSRPRLADRVRSGHAICGRMRRLTPAPRSSSPPSGLCIRSVSHQSSICLQPQGISHGPG